MKKNSKHRKENSMSPDVDAIYFARLASEDFNEIKEVDRKLSYSVVNPSSIICDVGAATGIEAFPMAIRGTLCVCLDINKASLKRGKILSKKRGIDTKIEFVVAS